MLKSPDPARDSAASVEPDVGAAILADSHVHLDRYLRETVSAMLGRARRAGVRHFLAIGVDLATSAAAVALARRRRGVRAAVGVHPTRVGGLDLAATVAELRQLCSRPRVAAVGEVGLDESSTAALPRQEAIFAACLDLAAEGDLAISLHVVGAHRRAREMLAAHRAKRVAVHYFQGDAALARAYLDLDCCISVGRPATRPERAPLRAAVQQIPLERLLLETDTYPLPGRTTEPRDIVEICRAIADLQGVPFETVARATTANYLELFGNNESPRSESK